MVLKIFINCVLTIGIILQKNLNMDLLKSRTNQNHIPINLQNVTNQN